MLSKPIHVAANINNAAVNIEVQVSFGINILEFFRGIYTDVQLQGHMVVLFLVFWEISIMFFKMAAAIYIPPNSEWWFPVFPHLHQCLLSVFLVMTDFLTGVRWYIIVFLTFIYLIINSVEHLFICFLSGKMSVQFFCSFFKFFFFMLSCMSCFYLLDVNSLWLILFANIFPHSVSCLFIWQWFPLLYKSF